MRTLGFSALAMGSLIAMACSLGGGPPLGAPLSEATLAAVRGADPATVGFSTNTPYEIASGYQPPSGCNSVNLGATCILCGGFSSPAYIPRAGASTRLTNPTERTCNALGYIGTCAYGPTGLSYCDAPESPNGQCSASYMAYAQQPE